MQGSLRSGGRAKESPTSQHFSLDMYLFVETTVYLDTYIQT
jgi:hypothetical protein